MDSPHWLTPDEQQAWRAFLEAGGLVMNTLDRQLQRDAGIPHSYFEVLIRLSEAPERTLRMSELAQLSLSSRSRLSHAVSRLEERGWVSRRDCDTDRRGQLATLTDTGFDALTAAVPGHVAAVRAAVIDRLSPEQLRLLGEITRVVRDGLLAGEPVDAGDEPAATRAAR